MGGPALDCNNAATSNYTTIIGKEVNLLFRLMLMLRSERCEHGTGTAEAKQSMSMRSPAVPARPGASRPVALLEVELRRRGEEVWHRCECLLFSRVNT